MKYGIGIASLVLVYSVVCGANEPTRPSVAAMEVVLGQYNMMIDSLEEPLPHDSTGVSRWAARFTYLSLLETRWKEQNVRDRREDVEEAFRYVRSLAYRRNLVVSASPDTSMVELLEEWDIPECLPTGMERDLDWLDSRFDAMEKPRP